MWQFSVSRAFGLMVQTLPFLLLRLAVYFGITLGYIVVAGVGAGVGFGVGAIGGKSAGAGGVVIGGFIGLGIFGLFMYWVREYILYLVKAGHIAVLVKLLDGESMQAGKSQISHATSEVKSRFAQSSVLFGIDQLVKGVVHAISGAGKKPEDAEPAQ